MWDIARSNTIQGGVSNDFSHHTLSLYIEWSSIKIDLVSYLLIYFKAKDFTWMSLILEKKKQIDISILQNDYFIINNQFNDKME